MIGLFVSAVGWGVVWGKTSQRLKTAEERLSEETARAVRAEEALKKEMDVMKAERQDLVVAVARLEVKMDALSESISDIKKHLA